MRVSLQVVQLLLLLLLLFVSAARSAAIEGNLEKALYVLPKCSVPCFVDSIKLSTCEAGNTTCICNDKVVAASLTPCVKQECGVNDQLDTLKVTKNACSQASRDLTSLHRRVNWAMLALCTPFAILRLLSKVELPSRTLGAGWVPSIAEAGWDDLCLLLAWCCTVIMGVIIGVPLQRAALGRDLWTLSRQQLVDTGYWIYVSTPVYFSSHAFLKASFLFFYLRVFGIAGSMVRFFGLCPLRPLLIGTLWLNLVSCLVLLGLAIGQCSPVSYSWTQWVESSPGSCLDIRRLLWAQAIINMLLDFWVLALPLSQISKLHRSLPTKLGVAAMFSLGIITTVMSIIRARMLDTTGNGDNPGMMMAVSANWSMVESSVGIVCACLPGMRKFFVRTIPKAWSWAGRSLGSASASASGGGGGTSGSVDQQQQQLQLQHRHRPRSSAPRKLRSMSGSLLEPTVVDARDKDDDGPYQRISGDAAGLKGQVESFAMADLGAGDKMDGRTTSLTMVSYGEGLERPCSAAFPLRAAKATSHAEPRSLPTSPGIWTKPNSFGAYKP